MIKIKLHNTLTRKKQTFVPLDENNVRLYLCGPTVYDRAHLGNARNVIMFDVLYRLLIEIYGIDSITYVRNFTDIDDKINNKSLESGRPIDAITSETIKWYLEDMAALGNLEPNLMPRATDYIPQMISYIELLIKRGFAYPAEGHVLFSVSNYKNYGRLSGRSVEDMIAGARVEVASYKRNPMDFVLWKPSEKDLPGWDSPWGRGRPGWHIECSAMAHDLLGATFDIHGGGNDLQFPHHENEIAQSCCAYPESEFARYWLHNEMLQVDGKKMSKSLGNFFTVRDLLDQGYPGEVIRFVFLSTHYSKPMDWTYSKALEAKNILRKWRGLLKNNFEIVPVPEEVIKILTDDLNTAGVISLLHNYASNGEIGKLKAGANFLGILTEELSGWCADVDMSSLEGLFTDLRKRAIESKNFENIDELRSKLTNAGVDVQIGKSNVALVPNASFDLQEVNKIVNFYGLN
jgi:cysteinyl-tRNA synthetase|tara:strand:- start:2905 stop:4287 length:1383 start_codon:yes stop_codon:yes gene_type:complete